MFLLLLTLTVGVAEAGSLFYEVQQQEQQPPTDGYLCPDQASRCPYTATCCQLSSGQWGCCPFEHATCCGDNVHCCPSGYSCNKAKEQCVRAINNDTIPWAKKVESAELSESSSSEEAVGPSNGLACPDRTFCPGIASCCRSHTGAYRCCNYPNTVCCSDGLGCCPRCTICDQLNNKCISGFETEKWETMTPSVPSASLPSKAAEKLPAMVVAESGEVQTTQRPLEVVWCDSTNYCRDGQTCCWLPIQRWGCCPYPSAVCCSGSSYCCPNGQQCSNPPGRCN